MTAAARTLMVMAGGTGGHVFPGLAVAHRMQAWGWRVVWLGNPAGMEATLVPKHGIAMEYVRFGGLRGKGLKTKLMLPVNLLRACAQSLSVHEQNSIAGLANKVLAKVAKRVLVAFPDALPHAEWTGNPIREELALTLPPKARYAQRSGPLNVLVVGGSLGATALNEVVPRALALLEPEQRPRIVHQAGAKHIDALKANYAEAGLQTGDDLQLVPFIDDMGAAYAKADLVICRSGAMTVAEIAAVGVAAFFVPFPYAVDDHQTTNAAFLADHGAALLVQQRDLTAENLAAWLRSQTRETLADMAERSRSLAKPDATEQVAQICAAVAGVIPSLSPEGRQQ